MKTTVIWASHLFLQFSDSQTCWERRFEQYPHILPRNVTFCLLHLLYIIPLVVIIGWGVNLIHSFQKLKKWKWRVLYSDNRDSWLCSARETQIIVFFGCFHFSFCICFFTKQKKHDSQHSHLTNASKHKYSRTNKKSFSFLIPQMIGLFSFTQSNQQAEF